MARSIFTSLLLCLGDRLLCPLPLDLGDEYGLLSLGEGEVRIWCGCCCGNGLEGASKVGWRVERTGAGGARRVVDFGGMAIALLVEVVVLLATDAVDKKESTIAKGATPNGHG